MAGSSWHRDTRIRLLYGDLIYREAGQAWDTLRQKIEGVKQRALNLRPVYERFRDVWFRQNQRVFAAEGLPTPWPQLSPAYSEWKNEQFPGMGILRRTDRMYRSFTQMTPDTVWSTGPRVLRFGSRVPYWVFHQGGTSKMPQRRPLVLLPESFSELNAMVLTYLTQDLFDSARNTP